MLGEVTIQQVPQNEPLVGVCFHGLFQVLSAIMPPGVDFAPIGIDRRLLLAHRRTVRSLRFRYLAISFQESSRSPRISGTRICWMGKVGLWFLVIAGLGEAMAWKIVTGVYSRTFFVFITLLQIYGYTLSTHFFRQEFPSLCTAIRRKYHAV